MNQIFGTKGVLGEGIFTIYRLLLVALIAFVILGLSAVFYPFHIDVRDAEAALMARGIITCLAPEGVLDIDAITEGYDDSVLSYCGYDSTQTERFFARARVFDASRDEVATLIHGDSGRLWVKDAFDKLNLDGEGIGAREPGYFPYQDSQTEYVVEVVSEGSTFSGILFVEVLVSDEF